MANLINVALRGITLFSKFILIFFMAKYLDPEQVGLYGLLTATIGYAFYFLGYEFYTFSNRELIKKSQNEWARILKSQAVFTALMYLIFLPFMALIFVFGLLPSNIALYFFGLLLVEHASQEFNRLFVAAGKPLLASLILFIRSAIWVYVVIIMMFLSESTRSLEFVLQSWMASAFCACLISAYVIYKMNLEGWRNTIDFKWIRLGVLKATPFFLAAAAIRGLFTIDRYWMESLTDLKTVGAYVLFMSISNALISFLDSGVFVFSYPRLIKAIENHDPVDFKKTLKKLSLQVISFLVLFTVSTLLLLKPVLILLGKQHYIDQGWMYPYLLMATAIFSLGLIPQYGLYAQNKDQQIVIGNILSFVMFLLSTTIASKIVPDVAVIIGLNVSLFFGSAWCTFMFFKKTPKEYLSR